MTCRRCEDCGVLFSVPADISHAGRYKSDAYFKCDSCIRRVVAEQGLFHHIGGTRNFATNAIADPPPLVVEKDRITNWGGVVFVLIIGLITILALV